MIEREPMLMRRDELVQFLQQRRDRAVFWNDRQVFPSQARNLAQSLDPAQVVSVWTHHLRVEVDPHAAGY